MIDNRCNFVTKGLVLREEEGVALLDRTKLRERSLIGPLLGIAREVCIGCALCSECNYDLEVVHDGIDWTIGVVTIQEG